MRTIEPEQIAQSMRQQGYVTDRFTLTALQLVLRLQKPLLVEGPAGVGKTEIAKALAGMLKTRLIRLQCYEGLDVHSALYEWNYQKQILHLNRPDRGINEVDIFSEAFLLRRPLLEAISDTQSSPVLLIDEIDRADEEFEAFLLELLGEFQVTIPEWGTIKAIHRPYVILTSNRTRELSDALRRRCLYQWLPFPEFAKERDILLTRLPTLEQQLASQIARLMEKIRLLPLRKTPGIAESLDWAEALLLLHQSELSQESIQATLGCIAKVQEDWETITDFLSKEEASHLFTPSG